MKGRVALMAAVAAALAIHTAVNAGAGPAVSPSRARSGAERYHYRVSARVRPLLFWIRSDNVGDAVATRWRGPEATGYSLLIGSDPDRAPLHINRWGYIEEETRGDEAQLIGLMTNSDEDSIEQAEANVRRQSTAHHPFTMIQATADRDQSRSRVRSIAAPENYTLRQMQLVFDLGLRGGDWKPRALKLPTGTRPGFLTALAEAIHTRSTDPIRYVYYGRIFELRRTHAATIPNLQIGRVAYGPAIDADYLITSAHDGGRTRFSITYGTRAPFAEVPLRVMYQPRWWMQVELTIDESSDTPALPDVAIQ